MNPNFKNRFEKHLTLKDIGTIGMQNLFKAKVLIIGIGGLGSITSLYLAASGIGTLGLIDKDNIELSNLQRQILYQTKDVGEKKVFLAQKNLKALNPLCKVNIIDNDLNEKNASGIIGHYDFIVDGSDNFKTKDLINRACVKNNKPFSLASVLGFDGQMMTIIPKETACWRCVFPKLPFKKEMLSCNTQGVLGPVVGIMGSIQATETIKYLTHCGQPLTNTLLMLNALEMNFKKIKIKKNNQCLICKKILKKKGENH